MLLAPVIGLISGFSCTSDIGGCFPHDTVASSNGNSFRDNLISLLGSADGKSPDDLGKLAEGIFVQNGAHLIVKSMNTGEAFNSVIININYGAVTSPPTMAGNVITIERNSSTYGTENFDSLVGAINSSMNGLGFQVDCHSTGSECSIQQPSNSSPISFQTQNGN